MHMHGGAWQAGSRLTLDAAQIVVEKKQRDSFTHKTADQHQIASVLLNWIKMETFSAAVSILDKPC